MIVWVEFFVCALFLTYFAYHLCREGIVISEKTRIEEGIIGTLFLAIATSFPEIVASVTSVFFLGKIGLGYGDIAGSIMINLMILAGLDYYIGKGRLLLKVSSANRLTGIFTLGIGALVLGAAVLRTGGMRVPALGRIGIEGLFVVMIYLVYLKTMKGRQTDEHPEVFQRKEGSRLRIWAKFVLLLVIVMLLGVWMARIGEKFVLTTALSQTFIGTLFLGVATSLPEIIVSFAAIKAGSIDMAVGNIFGSNLFDICIIPFLDLLTESPILGILSPGQIMATAIFLVLSAIAVFGMFVKRDVLRRINWDTGFIFVIGLAGFVLLYFIH